MIVKAKIIKRSSRLEPIRKYVIYTRFFSWFVIFRLIIMYSLCHSRDKQHVELSVLTNIPFKTMNYRPYLNHKHTHTHARIPQIRSKFTIWTLREIRWNSYFIILSDKPQVEWIMRTHICTHKTNLFMCVCLQYLF